MKTSNIIKKFREWLIRKLGGKPRYEYGGEYYVKTMWWNNHKYRLERSQK